ncbi:MAG TPA: RNA-binding domain-containing protein [Nitrosopumilaceae archaeon]|nr:RNA-binding domain-containing protein [Nitrosopumilaceae archaeon]
MVNHIEIIIEIIVHATEDTKKIFEPILELFDIKEEEFVKERLEGHFGNPILLMKVKLGKIRAEEFVKRLVAKISKSQMDEFLQNMEMYFEGSSLFMRISKGELVRKSISLQQNDALKIKISTPVYKKSELVKTYLDLLVK